MAHPPRLTLAGLLLGFLLFVSPSEANQCTTGCHGIHKNKAYQEGRTYTYQLDGESITSVTDAQGEATFKLNAIVELLVKPDCVHQIKLKNVKINGASASQGEIERHALQFNYHNGHIDTDVCAEAGDTQASLNVKRAVISLFQDAVVQDEGTANQLETDIFGACPTDFTFSKNGEIRTIKKERNLERCSYRENIKQDLISATFNSNADIKSTPLLDADLKVEQQFDRGVLKKASSVETYKFKPFSNGEAGAKTVVETTLTFKGESSAGSPAQVSESKSLIFEAPHQVVRSSVEAITRALQAAKESMPDAVTFSSARHFAELVKVLRQSSARDITAVYSRVKSGSGSDRDSPRKVLLDALFRTGTGEATEALVALVKNRELSEIETIIYYTSLAFLRHSNLAAISSVSSLLDQPKLPRIGYLGIGSLIGKYCQEHKCENVREVNAALAKIASKIVKATTRNQEDNVIAALKGLGNARYLDDATLIKVAGIAADKSVQNRVRVAALEALPTRCSQKWKEIIGPTFADRSEDSEIRIKAYLSLVACSCPYVARTLKETLEKEDINQVGSFVTSHLRNLRASTNPDKAKAQQQLGLIKPTKKFPEDFRKYSFNNEFSYIIDTFGVGSSMESNVIYSQNSLVPRSVNFNLTSEVFGHTFNFLELDARFENLDRLIEEYFGPKGHLRPSNLKDVVLDGRKTYDEIIQQIKNRFQKKVGRHARDVSQQEITNFGKQLRLPETELNDDLEIDLCVKLFGAELGFVSYQHGQDKLSTKSIVDQILNFFESGLDKAKDFNYHFKNHIQFLDAELVYPTGLGFPLSLGVTGTSAVHLKTSGKIDLVAIYKNPKSTSVQIALEPSASIQIAGSLTIEGYGIESGLKVITTLHTATGTDVTLKILEGNGIDINFGIPKQKQELITLKSEVLISAGAKGDNYIAPKFSKGTEYNDCFDQLSGIVGFTVCGGVSYPYDSIAAVQKKALFPLSGPTSVTAYLQTNDVKSYHFKAYYNTENPKARSFEILLETPNSRTDRRVSLLLEAAIEPEKLVRIVFDSPFKKASIEGIIKNNAKEQTLTVTVHHDSIEYFVRTGIVASGNKYRPLLEYKVPDHVEKLAGVKNGVKNTKRNGQQYTVGGLIEIKNINNGKQYILDKVTFAYSGQPLISFDGNLGVTSNGGNADFKIDYGDDIYAVKGNALLSNQFNYKMDLSIVPAKHKQNGFSVSFETKGTPLEIEENLVIVLGNDLNSKTNRVTYHGKHTMKYKSPQDFEISIVRRVTYPALNMVMQLEGGVTPNYIGYDVEFMYAKFALASKLFAKTGVEKRGDYQIEFAAKLQANSIEFKTRRYILTEHANRFTTSLVLQPGGTYELDTDLDYIVKPNDINAQLGAELRANGKKMLIETGLEANANKVSSRAIINYEGTKYLEFIFLLNRGNYPNGNVKLNLKNYLTASGNFKYQKDQTGDAQIEINIPKFNRKITGHGEVSIVGSKHNANLEILYDASKDPKKRIKISSVNDFTKTSFDTKNNIEILDYRTVVNAKGTMQGETDNGKQTAEFDITLPNGRFFTGKGNRAVTTQDNIMDGQMQFEFADHVTKGGKSRKIIYLPEIHNFNKKAMTFQSKQELKFVDFNGGDVKLLLQLKNLPNGSDKRSVGVQFEVTGSKVPSPFNLDFKLDAENEGAYGTGSIRSSLGPKLNLQANVNYVRGNNVDKPMTEETSIEINLPSDKLKSIKLALSDSLLIPDENGGRFEFIEKIELTYNNDKTIKLDSHFTSSGIPDETHITEGSGKVTVSLLSNAPITVGYNYKHNPLKELKEAALGLNLNYGNKQTSFASDSSYSKSLDVLNINIKVTTPIEKARNIELKLQHKNSRKNSGGKLDSISGKTDLTLIVEQARYTCSNEFEGSEQKADVHTIATSPEGRLENIIKFNKLGEKEYSGEFKLSSPHGSLDVDGRANINSIDDFSILINFDSDKLKTRKIHVEIANKLAKAGKRIAIIVTADGKNIVTGSTNYKKHSDGNKIIVEGNGSLKIRDSTKSSSFKYTHQRLTSTGDGEAGVDILLNFNFGESNIVGEWKLTNKELHIFNSYCEQKADCAQFKLQAKSTTEALRSTDEATIEVDLRKFNVPYEFGLKSNQVVDIGKGFDHATNLYLHSSTTKTQYSYQIYFHPTESGVVVTLPTRELALIASLDIPKNKRAGAYKIDVSSYWDRKGRPKEKTSLIVAGDVTMDKDSGSITGEARFMYPSHPKDLVVKGKLHVGGAASMLDGNLDIDVFENKNQKIVVNAKVVKTQINQGWNYTTAVTITSQGQHLNIGINEHVAFSRNEIGYGSRLSYTDKDRKPKSVGILFSANPQQAHLLIHAPDQQLLNANSRVDLAKNSQKITTDISLFGRTPCDASLEFKDMNSFKFLYNPGGDAQNRLESNGRFVLGQVAEVEADSYKNGAKKELFHLILHLDPRQYMKPDLAFNKDNIAQVIDKYRTRTIEVIKMADEFIKNVTVELVEEFKDLLNHLKKARPNLKPLIDNLKNQLNQLKNELNLESETFKQLQEKLNAIFGGPITAILDAVKKITAQLEELTQLFSDLIDRVTAAFKSTLPELQKSWNAITAAVTTIVEEVATVVTAGIKAFVDVINAHKDEFKQFVVISSDLFQDITGIVVKAANKIQTEVTEFFNVLVAEIKALPIYEIIQQKYKEIVNINMANAIIRSLDDVVVAVKRLLPTKPLEEFVTSIHAYVVAHLKQEKVDEVKELKKLYNYALQAIQSIINLPQTRASIEEFFNALESRIPFDFDALDKLPGISTFKVSLVSLLRNQELPSLDDLFYAYRPVVNPDYITTPFRKFAVFLDGGHFFTFDGRHLTYPGKCSYVLAQDGRDGNFSVVVELKDGKLASVTVAEPTESITIKSNGAILVNNQPSDFPASTKNLHAYVRGSIVQILSDYGLGLVCNKKAPMICKLYVSAFYHGRVRGILGNANNEPSDDFMLPSGKVVESEVDFGHGYRLGAQCPAVRSVHHQHGSHQSPQCTEFFTGKSSLSRCFNFVDPRPFREGCEHAVATGGQKEAACMIGAAYQAVCRESGIYATLPTGCGSCQVGNQKIDVGDSFSTQYPKQQADIVFVLEQATENVKIYHELIVALMTVIKSELKDHGITDVHFGLIGYGDQLAAPVHYTYKGSLNVDGEVKNIEFTNRNPTITLEQAKAGDLKKKIEFLGQKLDIELGTLKLTTAYEEALAYDFRPGATRTIVGVIATPCEKSPLPISLQQVRLLLGHKAYRDLGLTYHQIATLDDILISGKAVKNVVGFDSDGVFTFADSKRKPVEGNAELKSNMVLASGDVCAQFAADSGGAAFSAHNFLEAKANQKKQFIQVTGRRLVNSLLNTEIRSDCVCSQGYGSYPTPSCTIVQRKEKESIARPTKTGTKG